MNRGQQPNPGYLLIIGAPKCATTSIFRYLSDHPEVICPANRKETYFFAREFDYDNVCKVPQNLESFENYFAHCSNPGRLRMEGTPYTMYSQGAARTIHDMLPNAKIVVILRDPVERLLSDYRFHKQRDHPSARSSFNHFIDYQLNNVSTG